MCAGHGEEYNNEWTLRKIVNANFNSDRSKVNGYIPRGLSSFEQFTFSGTILKKNYGAVHKGFSPKFTMVFRNLFVIMSIKLEIAKKVEMFFNKNSLASDGILARHIFFQVQHLTKSNYIL